MRDYQRTIWHYFIIVAVVMSIASIAGFVTTCVYHTAAPHAALLWGELFGVTIWIDLLAWLFPKLCKVGNARND